MRLALSFYQPPPPSYSQTVVGKWISAQGCYLARVVCFLISLNQYKSALGPSPSRLGGNSHYWDSLLSRPVQRHLLFPKQQVGPSAWEIVKAMVFAGYCCNICCYSPAGAISPSNHPQCTGILGKLGSPVSRSNLPGFPLSYPWSLLSSSGFCQGSSV